MAVPKKRRTITRRRKGMANMRFHLYDVVKCTNCGGFRRSHRVCGECGLYRGMKVA